MMKSTFLVPGFLMTTLGTSIIGILMVACIIGSVVFDNALLMVAGIILGIVWLALCCSVPVDSSEY